jgi:glycosyltransferase involved in cell wall biosynthesis
VFDDGERGSELSWAYKIADIIASKNQSSIVVTGFKNLIKEKKYKIVELQKNKKNVDLGIFNAFKFSLQYFRFTYLAVKKEKFDVLHHVLPFGIDRTFNLFFLLGDSFKIPKIIGPVQSPLPFYKDNLHDAKVKKENFSHDIYNRLIVLILHPLLKFLSTSTLRKADRIIVINEITKKILLSRGIDAKKIVIIPPGIDCSRFSGNAYMQVVDKDNLELIAVGGLIKRKGFDLIIKAIAEVVKTNKNIKLRILGDGPQRKDLANLVRSLSVEKFVVFEGRLSHREMGGRYKKSQVFINMSRAEGFATVCLEAMASGLAIISSKVGGFNDAIKNGVNGYLVEQEDYMELSKCIKRLLENEHLINKIGQKAREDAVKKYDWQKVIIPQYLKIYREVINKKT